MFNLLIVEDDYSIREMLTCFLESEGFAVMAVENGESAVDCLLKNTPDLILLDWMLPDISGPTLLKGIRKNKTQSEIPVIMLTARAEEEDKIKGLDVGADDYMTKPVSLHELNARINALLRRAQGLNEERVIKSGAIQFNPNTNQVLLNNHEVFIAKTELNLLKFFIQHPDRVYSRDQLLDFVWGQSAFLEERTVDVHILRLRKILKRFGLEATIKTVRGLGYQYIPQKDEN